MSELIETVAGSPKDVLKHLILQLHSGFEPARVQRELLSVLGRVPYGLVVEVEQELIEDGMPPEEVTRLCHLHSAALDGALDRSGERTAPPGHPVHTFKRENEALSREIATLEETYAAIEALPANAPAGSLLRDVRARFNAIADVEKHYLRKEYLLFPYLETRGIDGPPKVMWAKHDEARALLRSAEDALVRARLLTGAAARDLVARTFRPASDEVREMIAKEENILFPMCMDALEEGEWGEIARQSGEHGFCLVEPEGDWRPAGAAAGADAAPGAPRGDGKVRFPTGALAVGELQAMLDALPLDVTFVDREDRVRWFSAGPERVFSRNRAVLGRKVQNCHPPSSVDVVDRILGAFRAGTKDRAAFWLELRGRFVHVEYVALRGAAGEYLGCLEVTQDLTAKRALTGERRLLDWDEPPQPRVAAAPPVVACEGPGCGPEPRLAAAAPDAASAEAEAWIDPGRVVKTLDARPMLAAGEHPLARVLTDLAALERGEQYVLVTPFVPGPLLERARSLCYLAHSVTEPDGLVRTWFARREVA